ncbi:efflux transporter outer membrane subunit [Pseudomonas cremoricolorata]|uniref:RND transporter n=1 Tax=Pseudomonas cremoricolorata TaxID=157783 RepID=A0A089YCQ5_9PSED|nr:efflux transporter outer membrane subunit [Pseudomonas cremoricolorata]AIR89563.1 RND transporter [Pseudomonas cremoricolorata]
MLRRLDRALTVLTACALSLTLSGCIATSDITPHSQRLDPDNLALDSTLADAERDAHWPAQRWWQAYGDAQLDQFLNQALAGSPSLALALARLRQAKALAGVAESAQRLQGDGDAALKRHNWPQDAFYGPGDLSGATTWDNHAGIGLSYPLDLWGQARNASEQALDIAHRRAAEARQAQLELQNNVVKRYIELALLYARHDIVERQLAQQQQILGLAQRRLDAGMGTHLEVSLAQAPLPETHRQLDSLVEAMALTRNQLAALAGLGPGAGARLQRPQLRLANPLGLPATLPAELLGQRPDVVARRWQVAAQARGIEVAQARFLPNIDLVGNLGFIATGGSALGFLSGRTFNYGVGPALSVPIFDGGRLREQLGAAAAGYDEAVADYNQTLVLALKDISDQLIRRESMQTQAHLADESVAAAQRSYDIASVAFQRGLTGYLEVLDAQTLLLRQQQVQQQVWAARLSVHADLATALGGGLQAGADTPASTREAAPDAPAALAVFIKPEARQ